jgi:acetolactate synthase-1/2/3 large subunit
VLLSQADLILAIGCRLAYQQTGFNWADFAPGADIVQVFPDANELAKGHPPMAAVFDGDADAFLDGLTGNAAWHDANDWVAFCRHVREHLPIIDPENATAEGFVSPYAFCERLSSEMTSDDIVIVASSGGANSVPMQTLSGKQGQIVITNNGLASMGYALSGAIGAAIAHPMRRVIHIEGDGGFAQKLQELAIVDVNQLNIKSFIWANEGYGSIRQTQRNYFGGAYLGCDTETGLGFPDWPTLFKAYGIKVMVLHEGAMESEGFREAFEGEGPYAFIIPIDTEQTYLPKITSRVTESGSMESNPLHHMTPELPADVAADVLRYLS